MNRRSLVVVAAVVSSAVAAHADNILTNPGFETGDLTGWTPHGGGVSFDHAYSGTHAGSVGLSGYNEASLTQGFTPVPTAQVDELSFWYKTTGSEYAQTLMIVGYADGSDDSMSVVAPLGEWTWFNVAGLLDPGKELSYVEVWGGSVYAGAPGDPTCPGPCGPPASMGAFYDDFVVDVVPAPGSLALLLGALGTARARRRIPRLHGGAA